MTIPPAWLVPHWLRGDDVVIRKGRLSAARICARGCPPGPGEQTQPGTLWSVPALWWLPGRTLRQ